MAMYPYDIEIVRGETYDNDIDFSDSSISLEGKTAKSQVRPKLESDVLLAEMTCNVDSETNTIHLNLTSAQTSALQPGTYAYDVFLIGTGFRKCYVGGQFIVRGRSTIVEEEKVTVSGVKTWIDNDNPNRPASITIKLFANYEQVDSKTVTAADNWAWTFENLPKMSGSAVITYTITEDAVTGYTTEVNGYNVTNTITE